MISIQKSYRFKESSRQNYCDGLADYLKPLFQDEYSPIATYMNTVSPECDVIIQITVIIKK